MVTSFSFYVVVILLAYAGIFALVLMWFSTHKKTNSNTNRISNLETSVRDAWGIIHKLNKKEDD